MLLHVLGGLASLPKIKAGDLVLKTCLLIFAAASMVGCGGSASLLTSKASTPSGSTSTSGSNSNSPSAATSSTSTSSSTANRNPAQGHTLADLEDSNGWTGYALLPPWYGICGSCSPTGPQTTWSSSQGVNSPSLTGKSMQFTIGGKVKYSDVLWNNHLIGQFSSQGMPDSNNSIDSASHNFVYDVYFFGNQIGSAQALEFDINQFVNGHSYIWGHECRIAGGNEWDVWDNPGQKWLPTGVGCWPRNNQWNHLTIQVQRTSDGHLLFQSITLNGSTATLNRYDTPTPTQWSGITVNYQQDGNQEQQPYSIWLDKFNFRYW